MKTKSKRKLKQVIKNTPKRFRQRDQIFVNETSSTGLHLFFRGFCASLLFYVALESIVELFDILRLSDVLHKNEKMKKLKQINPNKISPLRVGKRFRTDATNCRYPSKCCRHPPRRTACCHRGALPRRERGGRSPSGW